MARRGFPNFSLIVPREPPGAPKRPRGKLTFSKLWIGFLPLSIAALAASILTAEGDPERRSYVMFMVGIGFGAIGLLSLVVGLIEAAKAERARLKARDEAKDRARGASSAKRERGKP